MIKKIIAFLFLSKLSEAYNLCVVGASSGLGRELIYQGITERDIQVLGLSGISSKISMPCRENSFNEIKNQNIFEHPNLLLDSYWNNIIKYEYDNLVLTTSAKPFENDYSDILLSKILENLPDKCKTITLISAYGAGNTLEKSNLGIEVMNSWYLKDVYRAKNEQEKLLRNFRSRKIEKYIYYPKALSYGDTKLESISRRNLAREILNNIEKSYNNKNYKLIKI